METLPQKYVLKGLIVISLLYFLLVAVRLISSGFQIALGAEAKDLFNFATNPFLGLIVGILATALIQSSSTVISILVGLVAGGLPLSIAIPIVMGANVGTTITNTIVSLGYVKASEEFKRAFAAATVHDCFNFCCLLLFFPLEISFHFLEKMSKYISNFFFNSEASWNLVSVNVLDILIKPMLTFLIQISSNLPPKINGVVLAILGIILIFGTIFYLSKTLKSILVGKAREILHNAIGNNPLVSIFVGTGITCLIQSSSAATSLMIPLAGNGVFTLEQIYPFTLGTNIGTCLTALLAATALTGETANLGLEIALVHLLYNSVGVLIIYSLPIIREFPLQGARFLAEIATRNKWAGFGYILIIFLLLPILGLGIIPSSGGY